MVSYTEMASQKGVELDLAFLNRRNRKRCQYRRSGLVVHSYFLLKHYSTSHLHTALRHNGAHLN